jgi:hypothetical protein
VLKNNIDHQNVLLATVEGVKLLVHTMKNKSTFGTCLRGPPLENDLKLEDLINRFEKYVGTSLSRTGLDIAFGVINCTQNKKLPMKTSFKQIKFEKNILA